MNNLSELSSHGEIVDYLKRIDLRLTAVENALHLEPQVEVEVASLKQAIAP